MLVHRLDLIPLLLEVVMTVSSRTLERLVE